MGRVRKATGVYSFALVLSLAVAHICGKGPPRAASFHTSTRACARTLGRPVPSPFAVAVGPRTVSNGFRARRCPRRSPSKHGAPVLACRSQFPFAAAGATPSSERNYFASALGGRYFAMIPRITATLSTKPVSATIWEMSGPSNRMDHLSALWSWRIMSSTSQFSACPCPWFPSRGSDGLLVRSFRTMRR
jgi:hypothetical protein